LVYSETSEDLAQPDLEVKTVPKERLVHKDQLQKLDPKEPKDLQDLMVFPEHRVSKVHKVVREIQDQ